MRRDGYGRQEDCFSYTRNKGDLVFRNDYGRAVRQAWIRGGTRGSPRGRNDYVIMLAYMPRERKNNAEYFTHDKDMRNDRKIKPLRNRFGNEGYAVYNMFLEVLADSDGFEIVVNDFELKLLAGDFDIEDGRLREIIAFMIELHLLVRKEIDVENYLLYSEGLKKRMQPMLEERERKRLWAEKRWKEQRESNDIDFENNPKDDHRTSETMQSRTEDKKVDKKNKDSKVLRFDDDDARLAGLLLERIRDNLPSFKKPDLDSWSATIGRMRRIDGRSIEQIEWVIGWAQADTFWRANILSAEKLRKQFDTLTAHAQRAAEKQSQSLKTGSRTGRLHDGTRVFKEKGVWKDEYNPVCRLDPGTYPEIMSDTVMTEEEWKENLSKKHE